jgi:hypothetical protein
LQKIRFSDLPHGLWKHLLERVQEREITLGDLGRLQEWVQSEPFAPDGDWYKDFGFVQAVWLGRVSEDGTHEGHGGVRQTNRVEGVAAAASSPLPVVEVVLSPQHRAHLVAADGPLLHQFAGERLELSKMSGYRPPS